MAWCEKLMHPLRRVYFGVTTRKSGLVKLQRDVRACEYEDIQVMWEMLKRSESEYSETPVRGKKGSCWKMFKWARCTPLSCYSS